jgi:ATP-dependent exoDNAse (exonuclease V) beta subunit
VQQQAMDAALKKSMDEIDPERFSNFNLYLQAYNTSLDDLQQFLKRMMEIAHAKPDGAAWLASLKKETPSDWFYAYFLWRIEAMLEILTLLENEVMQLEYSRQNSQNKDLGFLRDKTAALQQPLEDLQNKDYPAFRKNFLSYISSTPRLKGSFNKQSFSSHQKQFKKLEGEIASALFEESVFEEDEKRLADYKDTFLDLCLAFDKNYQEEKRRRMVIDYADMEHFAYQLLQIDVVKKEVQEQFDVILVDEFQDTNDLQEAIISCFCKENNVFRVGDIKQSIYGFRQARPQIMKEHLAKTDENNEAVYMADNYRSNASIIEFNNDFYNQIMNNCMHGNLFGKEDLASAGTSRQSEDEQRPVRFLFTQYQNWAAEHDDGLVEAKKKHRQNKADLIAQDILVQKKKGIPYRSICILTRNHAVHEEIKEALNAYGIPVLAEIDHGFYTNQAIQIVLAALKILIDPSDDVAMTAFLCSSLGQVSHSDLANAAAFRNEGESLYEALKDSSLLDAYREISSWSYENVAQLLKQLYNYKDFYYKNTNGQDKTNLDLLMEMASGSLDLSLYSFIELVLKEAKLDKTSEAFPFGKEEDVVKIKTMHHAKGLQFPIVYIYSKTEMRDMEAGQPLHMDADLGLAAEGIDESLHLKRASRQSLAMKAKKLSDDLAEEMRLFYVATTRAEKELVIVDTISSLEDYDYPLSWRALLEKRSYTSWLLHTYYHHPSKLLEFDEKKELAVRPDKQVYTPAVQSFAFYSKPITAISSKTASNEKKKLTWPKISLSENTAAQRGTLFHEIVAKLPYPYQSQDIEAYAKKAGFAFGKTEIDQIQALNKNPLYASWMKMDHQFECSYTVLQNDAYVHGFMDLVVFEGDTIHVVDFKSDYVKDQKQLEGMYQKQLAIYSEAMKTIAPGKTVKTYLCSFRLGSLWSLE